MFLIRWAILKINYWGMSQFMSMFLSQRLLLKINFWWMSKLISMFFHSVIDIGSQFLKNVWTNVNVFDLAIVIDRRLLRIVSACLSVFEPVWGRLGLSVAVWACLRQSGAVLGGVWGVLEYSYSYSFSYSKFIFLFIFIFIFTFIFIIHIHNSYPHLYSHSYSYSDSYS